MMDISLWKHYFSVKIIYVPYSTKLIFIIYFTLFSVLKKEIKMLSMNLVINYERPQTPQKHIIVWKITTYSY